jgi:pimeloyl-ACP methyl ester carboxylesterase
MNVTLHTRVVDNDGVALHVAVAGDGPPVVLLHGFPESARSWRHQIAPLVEAGFSVWMPNLRGYPPSGMPLGREAYRLRHLVSDVAAIVNASGYRRAHIVGHDWGGIIAWAFAGRHPALLEKLVILNAPHMRIFEEKLWRSSQWLRSWYVAFFQLPWLPEKLIRARDYRTIRRLFEATPARKDAFTHGDIDTYVAGLSQPGALTAALNYYRANVAHADMALASTARCDAPTLIIWGKQDFALGAELLDGVERFAPRARIHWIEDAGHWIQNEAPEEVNRVLLDFLLGE